MQTENTTSSTRQPLKRLSYRPKEVAAITGAGLTRVWEWIGDGTLESVLVGKTRLVSAESVERLVRGE